MTVNNVGGLRQPLGITLRFDVMVDDGQVRDLGQWKSCKGLTVSFKHKAVYEGGIYDQPALILPEQVEYQTITLERAMHRDHSQKVQMWLQSVSQQWMNDPTFTYRGTSATITLYDSTCTEAVASWSLHNVYPAKWSGPSLDAMGSGAVALETLELVHHGFLLER